MTQPYSYKLDRGGTDNLYAGQYFAVVQHPMMNGIPISSVSQSVRMRLNANITIQPTRAIWTGGAPAVRLNGLQASDAANALVSATQLTEH